MFNGFRRLQSKPYAFLIAATEGSFYKREMKAFWWFKENEIAGMARPGFNYFRWLELPFQEALLLSWLGQQANSTAPIESFQRHILSYGPRINKFHRVPEDQFQNAIAPFAERTQFLEIFKSLVEKSQAVKTFDVSDKEIYFTLNDDRLNWEIEQLKEKGINTIITLNEHHHNKSVLEKHFNVHHFSIEDLSPPSLEQVEKLADVIKIEREQGHRLALHCLAGIGRTSTMILGAHILLGESPEEIEARIRKQNSAFTLSPTQAEFIKSVKLLNQQRQ